MYQKEIIYLSLMNGDIKEKNAGFMKQERTGNTFHLFLQLKNVMEAGNGNYPIRMQTADGWREIDMLDVADGCGNREIDLEEEVYRVEIILSDNHKVIGQSKGAPVKKPQMEPELRQEAITQPEQMKQTVSEIHTAEWTESDTPLCEDKWEQILTTYEKIHPYGDSRIYVKLEPKDFIVLRANYQHLVNNSFLLHGFYNYRYLILGKEKDFYLGVPGVFYEREKMVALMFGFEAFECEGGVAREGKFGYYLRKVEL
ncbi:MAG: hypothetical protein PUE95_00115 [Lachnospiraceae bacterium]|nr:hypothetical protein [Lachnospiraceae bacterium]MDD6811209.1 hypothetical protein [Lachnospiraceae bacterium]